MYPMCLFICLILIYILRYNPIEKVTNAFYIMIDQLCKSTWTVDIFFCLGKKNVLRTYFTLSPSLLLSHTHTLLFDYIQCEFSKLVNHGKIDYSS